MNARARFTVSLNGTRLDTSAPTLHTLLREQGVDLGAAIACAVNNTFVPRPQWPQRELRAGDCIDVITPITGG